MGKQTGGNRKKVRAVVLAVVLFVVGSLIGGAFACAAPFLWFFIAFNPDGNGTLSGDEWRVVLVLASMSVLSFVLSLAVALLLWRGAEKQAERRWQS